MTYELLSIASLIVGTWVAGGLFIYGFMNL
jgi:hypothetical protein